MPRLAGLNVLITGSSQGIGRGCAIEMAREGANVAVNYNSNAKEAAFVAEEVRKLGGKAIVLQGDVSNRQRYLNARSTLRTLLELRVIPVINENDTVATEEIKLGDNDTLGALAAVITVGWCFTRGTALAELSKGDSSEVPLWLYHWIRFGIPLAILAVGIWWLLASVLGLFTAV